MEQNHVIPFNAKLKLNFGALICGPPGAGKTHFALSLIEHADRILDKKLDYITWFFGEHGATDRVVENPKIKIVHGLPDDLDSYIYSKDPSTGRALHGLLVFDDLMNSVGKSEQISILAANKCTHADVSWIAILQNPFAAGKHRLDLSRCAHYMVLYKNPLDKSVARHMANKIMPKNTQTFINIYEAATAQPNGYLFIDGKQDTPEVARLRTDLFHPVHQRVFVPSKLVNSEHIIKNAL